MRFTSVLLTLAAVATAAPTPITISDISESLLRNPEIPQYIKDEWLHKNPNVWDVEMNPTAEKGEKEAASAAAAAASLTPIVKVITPEASVPEVTPVLVTPKIAGFPTGHKAPMFPVHRPHSSTTDEYLKAFAANAASHEIHYADPITPAGSRHCGGPQGHYPHGKKHHDCAQGFDVQDMVTSWRSLPWVVRVVLWISCCFGISMITVGTLASVFNWMSGSASIRLGDEEETQAPQEKTPLSVSADEQVKPVVEETYSDVAPRV